MNWIFINQNLSKKMIAIKFSEVFEIQKGNQIPTRRSDLKLINQQRPLQFQQAIEWKYKKATK